MTDTTDDADTKLRLADLRREYRRAGLTEEAAGDDPIALFGRWLAEAIELEVPDATAMVLATATPDGRPSARVVLLKGHGPEGFSFYTNHDSRKARELAANPHAALVFYWWLLERQVRIEGRVERLPPEAADAYFASRPRGSRLGAWASPQSRPIAGRGELEAALAEVERRFPGDDVPRPPHWGGYRMVPEAIELWQGRESRLHDRLRYRRTEAGEWDRVRLAP